MGESADARDRSSLVSGTNPGDLAQRRREMPSATGFRSLRTGAFVSLVPVVAEMLLPAEDGGRSPAGLKGVFASPPVGFGGEP